MKLAIAGVLGFAMCAGVHHAGAEEPTTRLFELLRKEPKGMLLDLEGVTNCQITSRTLSPDRPGRFNAYVVRRWDLTKLEPGRTVIWPNSAGGFGVYIYPEAYVSSCANGNCLKWELLPYPTIEFDVNGSRSSVTSFLRLLFQECTGRDN